MRIGPINFFAPSVLYPRVQDLSLYPSLQDFFTFTVLILNNPLTKYYCTPNLIGADRTNSFFYPKCLISTRSGHRYIKYGYSVRISAHYEKWSRCVWYLAAILFSAAYRNPQVICLSRVEFHQESFGMVGEALGCFLIDPAPPLPGGREIAENRTAYGHSNVNFFLNIFLKALLKEAS